MDNEPKGFMPKITYTGYPNYSDYVESVEDFEASVKQGKAHAREMDMKRLSERMLLDYRMGNMGFDLIKGQSISDGIHIEKWIVGIINEVAGLEDRLEAAERLLEDYL